MRRVPRKRDLGAILAGLGCSETHRAAACRVLRTNGGTAMGQKMDSMHALTASEFTAWSRAHLSATSCGSSLERGWADPQAMQTWSSCSRIPPRVCDYPDVQTRLSEHRAFLASTKAHSSFFGCLGSKGLEGDLVAKVGLLMTPVQQAQEASGTSNPFSTLSADHNVRIAITKTSRWAGCDQRTLALHACKVEEAR